MYDLIGDIHGHARELKKLLHKLGYREMNGVWQHEQRRVIFVGDYIDRGPGIRETLHIVRTMVENNQAIALLGNHEYNALAYYYKMPDGSFLRSHNQIHSSQHRETMQQFSEHESEWEEYLEWFYTLPLFLELPGLRVVHACWDPDHIAWMKEKGYTTMKKEFLVAAHKKDSKEYEVVEETLKGKEYDIPEEFKWPDRHGIIRKRNRYRWWKDHSTASLDEFLFDCPPELKTGKVDREIKSIVYPKEAPPVFFGHYWMEDEYPVIQSHNVICLDYSIGRKMKLVAYRWNGEQEIHNDHFVFVKYEANAW